MSQSLNGYRVLIMETREEAQFSRLLAERGADVLPCPMFVIRDAPDAAAVESWTRRFIESPCDELVLTTGEGLRRLLMVVRRIGIEHDFVAALGVVRTICRGPKPGRALREIGLEPQIVTEDPTSVGIANTLSRIDLAGHRVGLQLYPDRDHGGLIGTIETQGGEVRPILPYVYDAKAAESAVVSAIAEIVDGRIDAIALTSSGQIRRLIDVARHHACEAQLLEGLARTSVASIGPVVSAELASHGLRPDITPANKAYFIKPLVSALTTALRNTPPRSTLPR